MADKKKKEAEEEEKEKVTKKEGFLSKGTKA